MEGYKHLVQCHCVLPQFRNRQNPVYHKFTVFSVVDDSDTVVPSVAQCNNCGTVHKVFDICKSEILAGKDETKSAESIEDVSMSLPSSLVELFKNYSLDLPDYQMARFVLDNQKWDSTIVLARESESEEISGKLIRFVSQDKFRVEPFSRKDSI
jgi:hypothetical protein